MSMQSHVPRPSVASHRPHTAHHATRAACSLASSVGDRGPSGAAAPAHGSQLGVGCSRMLSYNRIMVNVKALLNVCRCTAQAWPA